MRHVFKHIIISIVYIGILLGIFYSTCLGQLANSFKHYTLLDGLPSNNVTAIAHDKYGYLWIGTDNGIVRFDGKYFTTFNSSTTLAELPSPEIKEIKNLDSNHLAVITQRGLNIIDISQMTSINLNIPRGPNKYQHIANNLRTVFQDQSGNIYVISKSGLYHFNKQHALVFRYDDYASQDTNNNINFGVYSFWLNESTILTKSANGMYIYNTKLKKLSRYTGQNRDFLFSEIATKYHNEPRHFILSINIGKYIFFDYAKDEIVYIDELKRSIVTSKLQWKTVGDIFSWRSNLYPINDSTFYISGKFSGMYTCKLQLNTGNIIIDTTPLFAHKKINSIFLGNNNKTWIGSTDGLSLEKENPYHFLIAEPTSELVPLISPASPIVQVAVSSNYVYGAAIASAGLHRFNKSTLLYDKKIPFTFPPFGNKSLFAVKYWTNNLVLCGSDAGLFIYNEKISAAHFVQMPGWSTKFNFIIDFYIDANKTVWITTNKKGGCYVWHLNAPNPIWFSIEHFGDNVPTEVYHITADTEGNIWLAGKGLARYNVAKNSIDIRIQNLGDSLPVQSSFDAVAVDKNGTVWLVNGYGSASVIAFEPTTKKITYFSVKNGLPDFKATALFYLNDYIWVVSKNGIAKIHSHTKKVEVVISVKEVHYQQFLSNSLVFDHTSASFYTSAGTSIFKFRPAYTKVKKQSPSFKLVFVKIGKDSIVWFPKNKIEVSWIDRNLTLFYNAINFEDPDFQKYAYRIVERNSNSEWVNQDDQRRIVLTNLKPGFTDLQIKVFSTQSAWPEEIIHYRIHVTPPFWRTNWFVISCIIILFSVVYILYKYRMKQLINLAAIKENISKDLHDEIGATLSGIAMYSHLVKSNIDRNEVADAARSIQIIQESAAAMITQLNDIIWLIKPHNELLEAIVNKLEIFSRELCGSKNIEPIIEVSLEDKKIIPSLELRKNIYLFCKEAINNAIKYSNTSKLLLSFSLHEHLFVVIIEDYGIGYDMETVIKGNGLDNMYKRAKDMHADVHTKSKPGAGCRIQLSVKITQ